MLMTLEKEFNFTSSTKKNCEPKSAGEEFSRNTRRRRKIRKNSYANKL